MTTQPTPAAFENPVAAHNYIMEQVWAPVFFEKLAHDYGIPARTPQDASLLLDMATRLRTADQQQAQDGNALLKQAHASLAGVTPAAAKQAADDQAIKQASAQVAVDPAIAHAILALTLAGQGQQSQQ